MNPTGYIQHYRDHPYTTWEKASQANKWQILRSKTGDITISYDLVLAGPLEKIAPHINGTIVFHRNRDGTYGASGERDGFPWAEAYYHNAKGGVQTIFQQPAIRGNPEDLNAIEGEYPFGWPYEWLYYA